MLPATYTTKEVAEALKVSVETVRDLVARTPECNPARLSGSPTAHMRFTEDDYQALVQALKPAVTESAVRKRRRKRAA